MEGITVGKALEVFASQLNRCARSDRDELLCFLHAALEEVRDMGAYGWLREWNVCVDRNCFKLPKGCETLLKYKYDEIHRGGVKGPFYSYSSNPARISHFSLDGYGGSSEGGGHGRRGQEYCDFNPVDGQLILQTNKTPLEHPIPKGKSGYLLFISSSEEDCSRKIEVSGCYKNKRVVPEDTYCEYVPITTKMNISECDKSRYQYDKIDSIVKPDTCGFVSLLFCCGKEKTLLATYDPLENCPQYKSVRAMNLNDCCPYSVCILGIQSVLDLCRDCDILPIESHSILLDMARRQQAKDERAYQEAQYLYGEIQLAVRNEMKLKGGQEGELDWAIEGSYATMDRIIY